MYICELKSICIQAMCRLVHIHPMVMFTFFHRFYPPHLETFSGSAIISDQLKRRLQNTVLGLSEHNYPMLNDIKLPLCYKMLQKPGPSIIVSCNPCLGFLPLFLLPRSLLSRPLAKVHFNQIEPLEFSAQKHLHFAVFVILFAWVGWLVGWVRHSSENCQTFIWCRGNKFHPGVTLELLETL